MIRYTIRCAAGHEFESWYKDSKTYETLQSAGAVACPDCGTSDVRRAPMAPALSGTKATRHQGPAIEEQVSANDSSAGPGGGAPAVPDAPAAPLTADEAKRIHVMGKIREAMVEVRRHVEANADYVGPKFADEARKIHYGETEERNIYGEATEAESEALKEEGIEFGQIPWVPKSDA